MRMVSKERHMEANFAMSTEKRPKTSLGLQIPNKERLDSVSELIEALEKERQMETVLMKSVEQWNEIIDEITTSMDTASPNEIEWKTRFNYQRLFNQMLQQQIGHIKTELNMLRQGHVGMSLPVMGQTKTSPRFKTVPKESQAYISSLEEKLKSLESLYNMYEHQRDDLSRDYHRLRDEINDIVKDVWFSQKTKIKRQEESDNRHITRSKTTSKRRNTQRTLPPIKPTLPKDGRSYYHLHGKQQKEAKSSTYLSKTNTADDKVAGKTDKRVTLPPIDNGKYTGRDKQKIPNKTGKISATSERMKRINEIKNTTDGTSLPAIKQGRVYGGFVSDNRPKEGGKTEDCFKYSLKKTNKDYNASTVLPPVGDKRNVGKGGKPSCDFAKAMDRKETSGIRDSDGTSESRDDTPKLAAYQEKQTKERLKSSVSRSVLGATLNNISKNDSKISAPFVASEKDEVRETETSPHLSPHGTTQTPSTPDLQHVEDRSGESMSARSIKADMDDRSASEMKNTIKKKKSVTINDIPIRYP